MNRTETALRGLKLMYRSRFFEEEVQKLFDQGKLWGTTHLSIGQEASHVGLCMALEDGDWIVPTHRTHGFNIARGSSMAGMFSEMFGSREGLCMGLGGSMHMTDTSTWNAGSSAVVGSGVPIGMGLAFALKRKGTKNIAVSIFGDGATSRGAVHESMNLAAVWEIPVLFYCENNGYGMSASTVDMVSCNNVSERAKAYKMEGRTVDGNDVIAVYEAVCEARKYIAETSMPYLLEVLTYRQNGHSKSDKCVYRERLEEEMWAENDPIRNLENCGLLEKEQIVPIRDEARKDVDDALAEALRTKDDVLSLDEALSFTYAPNDETVYGEFSPVRKLSGREAIREAMAEEFTRDENVFLMGEDIGKYGGCFGVTGNLHERFHNQILETPVSEEGFSALAVGASMLGLRPMIEIMYGDFCTLISDALINHASKIFFMSAGQLKCPMVLRTPFGCGTGHGAQHTQSLGILFTNVPGLKVVAPSCPKDAKALLKSAVRDNSPVVFCEHKLLYPMEGEVGDENYLMEIGKADIKRDGSDVVIIAFSWIVNRCIEVADRLRGRVSVSVVDMCSMKPIDEETIKKQIIRCGRVVLVQEAPLEGGFTSCISDIIAKNGDVLSAMKRPVVSLGGQEMPIPFSRTLEAAYVPSVDDIEKAVLSLMV